MDADEPHVPPEWEAQQAALKGKLVVEDAIVWGTKEHLTLTHVAGVDISFVKGDAETACASLVVLRLPEMAVVYEELRMVRLTQPYIPGFLAFREVSFLVDLLDTLKRTRPDLYPQVVLVDGNGVLHPRGFGLACHLGVLCDVPTIGVGKTLFLVDGIDMKDVKARFLAQCQQAGDALPLTGHSGRCWGVALKTQKNITKAVYVSVGHKLSLDSCVAIVMALSKYRLPEPIRFADQRSREYLRQQGFNQAGD